MTNFTLPPSYRDYCQKRAVQSAVDHVLDCGKRLKVPDDLEWDRLPDFHAAVLAAHQVRCDYATALHGLWKAVWQPALDHCGFADVLEPLSFNEHADYSGYPCDTYTLWKEALLERVYDKDGHKLGLGVENDPKQAWLTIWLLDGKGKEQTASLTLGNDWDSKPDEEGYLYTREKLARFSNDGCCIPIEPLNRAAQRALQEIGRILGLL